MRDFLNELDIDFKPDSLAYQIAEILKDAIFRGLLKSGEKLTETNLQKQFNTSRAPIREAFRILENSDLVDIYPRKGAFVKEISEKDIIESFPIRGSLEGLAAKFATPRLSQKNLDEMKYALEKMDTWKKKNGHRNYSKYHWRFHETFINNCGNDQLINLLKTLRQKRIWFGVSYFYMNKSLSNTIKIHQDIYDCFVSRKSEEAKALVEKHIIDALDDFINYSK